MQYAMKCTIIGPMNSLEQNMTEQQFMLLTLSSAVAFRSICFITRSIFSTNLPRTFYLIAPKREQREHKNRFVCFHHQKSDQSKCYMRHI